MAIEFKPTQLVHYLDRFGSICCIAILIGGKNSEKDSDQMSEME